MTDRYRIIQDDCINAMRQMEDNSIDFCITDPPYGLKFMGKKWDHGIPGVEYWEEMLRICKPGSMLAAFGGTRTYHRLACAIEDAGWIIRDCIMWLYGSGFPKSHNKFGLKGYGTALKPAWEPIILAMKPVSCSFSQNFSIWGLAGINIDESRIAIDENIDDSRLGGKGSWKTDKIALNVYEGGYKGEDITSSKLGRWPANLILDEEAAQMLDQMTGVLKTGSGNRRPNGGGQMFNGFSPMNAEFESSSGGASRFFYCAKASSSERNAGLEGMHDKPSYMVENGSKTSGLNDKRYERHTSHKNSHPTVKPLSLMRYIIKLLAPPGDPLMLDPFAGSGSSIIAAKQLGIQSIGIELDPEYCEIARRRIEAVKVEPKQLDLFDETC